MSVNSRTNVRSPTGPRVAYSITLASADATFAWDSRFSSASYDAGANKRKGGIVNVVADPEVAGRSRQFAVDFFTKAFSSD